MSNPRSTTLNPVRGTHDLLGADSRRMNFVRATAREVCGRYGFDEVETPIFEFTEVFARTLGETSDVVTKEMYTFTDKGGASITLRPENTAGVARSFISNGLKQQVPVKQFYSGPMFRYERPQKGRMRQFHQVGVELIGVAGPQADIEVIACGARLLDELGIAGAAMLQLNSLGDGESRTAYRQNLVAYLSDYEHNLSEDSRMRLSRNPLRILDSKDAGDRAVLQGAPDLAASLNDASRRFFGEVKDGLGALGIDFVVNPRLVRGLDYYCHTAFEFVTEALGAQGALIAGGRYDGLIAQMGGPDTPGVGWAAGIERLAELAGEPAAGPGPIAVVPVGTENSGAALAITERLRAAGLRVDLGYSGNMQKRLKRAHKLGAAAAVILGSDELASGKATLRDMQSGEQSEVALDALEQSLAPYR